MSHKLHVSLEKEPLVVVTRFGVQCEKLVYIICASKRVKYRCDKSPVVYIGMTQKGLWRVSQSVAYYAPELLDEHGITECWAYVVSCNAKPFVATWKKLENDS